MSRRMYNAVRDRMDRCAWERVLNNVEPQARIRIGGVVGNNMMSLITGCRSSLMDQVIKRWLNV